MDIAERNRLRAEAHLPLLEVAAESERLQRIKDKAAFETEWERRKPEFAEWIAGGQGWIAQMGRWCISRQQVAREFRERHGSSHSGR